MEDDRRQYQRIKYPDESRPILVIGIENGEEEYEGREYSVIDLSEKGIRLTGDEVSGLKYRSKIEAQITFSDGESVDVEGEVLRVIGNQVALYLSKGLSFSRIIQGL